MKAYIVFDEDPYWGCVLVYAENRNKAKMASYNKLFKWDYIDMTALRRPDYDKYYNGNPVIETNGDLPNDAPEFYIGALE